MVTCGYCGAECASASRVCPPCMTRLVDETCDAQGVDPVPSDAALRLVASVAYRKAA